MKDIDLKVLALGTVSIVLILLTIGAIIRAVRTGEGLDSGTASAAFALLGAMVAGSIGTAAAANEANKKNKEEEPTDIDPEDY
jgi:hypothetical protein